MTNKKIWLQNMTKAKIWLPIQISLGLPQKKKMSLTWRYDCKIWLEQKYDWQIWLNVPQICSLPFPTKYFGVPNRRIVYAREVQSQKMTGSHILQSYFPPRCWLPRIWLQAVASHPQSYFCSHKIRVSL